MTRSVAESPVAEHPVTVYAQRVIAGDVVAGRLVRLACERHLRDRLDLPARGFKFSAEHADHALSFIGEFLRFYDAGERTGEPFRLEPWQQFIVGSLFGWLGPGGFRRFRTAYIETGKGNGKTPLLACLGLYGLACDDEPGAQIFVAAVTREQAGGPGSLFADAKNMAAASPALAGRLIVGEHNIADPESKAFMRPISSEGKSLDGKRVHMALIDEIHEHPTATVVDKMRLGTKGRRQALIAEITNSGYDRKSVCWQHHELSRRILEGAEENESWFAYVCQLDPCEACRAKGQAAPQEGCSACDDWRNETTWLKANPNLDVSVTREYLRETVHEAIQMPAKQNMVRRLNFCQWTESATRWFTAEEWASCGGAVDPDRLRGRPCVAGLDLSTSKDLTALVLIFPDADFFLEVAAPLDPETGEVLEAPPAVTVRGGADVLAFFWCPADSIAARSRRDQVPYEHWRDLGILEPTPGNVIDYRWIRRKINALRAEGYDIREVAYDPAFATQFAQQLQDEDGFVATPISQGFESLTEAAVLLEKLVQGGQLRHGGHPLLAWNAANVVVDVDAGGRRRPSKGKSTERIDGISALVTGLKRLFAVRDAVSVYETRGVVAL